MSDNIQLAIMIFEGVAILTAIIFGSFQIKQYNDIKKKELEQKRFENYNLLIDRLIDQRIKGSPSLDIQKSVFFEFRNYPEYKEVSKNILEDWRKKFNDDKEEKYISGIRIIEDTLEYLQSSKYRKS
ncbi:MAG: hypothetical protein A2Z35_02370 [Actinobacteria bacterium RBG_19FT_COMBO_36_27]|nr:MAG: hypothetical protein A2Z35_02370 [Actinobacteria bacterium RBG_19FT_COMBO_36_27]